MVAQLDQLRADPKAAVPGEHLFQPLDFPARRNLRVALRRQEKEQIRRLFLQFVANQRERRFIGPARVEQLNRAVVAERNLLPAIESGQRLAREGSASRRPAKIRATNSSSGIGCEPVRTKRGGRCWRKSSFSGVSSLRTGFRIESGSLPRKPSRRSTMCSKSGVVHREEVIASNMNRTRAVCECHGRGTLIAR